jgi:threonine dehydrogenase-like Zn-dependent dehydrogenase
MVAAPGRVEWRDVPTPRLGFQAIHYVDESPERRTLAQRLGAHAVAASPREAGRPFAVIVDASGNEEWLHGAVRVLAPEGIIECLGGYFGDIRIPGVVSYFNGATIRCGVGNNGPHVHAAMDAVVRGVVQPSSLWAVEIGWEDLPGAFVDEPRKLIATRPPD